MTRITCITQVHSLLLDPGPPLSSGAVLLVIRGLSEEGQARATGSLHPRARTRRFPLLSFLSQTLSYEFSALSCREMPWEGGSEEEVVGEGEMDGLHERTTVNKGKRLV